MGESIIAIRIPVVTLSIAFFHLAVCVIAEILSKNFAIIRLRSAKIMQKIFYL